MTTTRSHTGIAVRRAGALLVMGVGAALVGLGASSQAAAAPYDPAVPFKPGDSIESRTNVVRAPSGPQLPENPASPPPFTGIRIGDDVSLNPQPLPPGPDRGIRVALNPQPLPPGPDLRRLPFLRLPGF